MQNQPPQIRSQGTDGCFSATTCSWNTALHIESFSFIQNLEVPPSPLAPSPMLLAHTHTGCGGADAQQWDGSWLLKSNGERGGVAGSRQRCINPHFQIWRKKRSLSEARPPHWLSKTLRGSAPRSSPWIQERLGTQLMLSNAEVG